MTMFVGEKRRDALDLGWASGTRASLRNTGLGPNGFNVTALAVTGAGRAGSSGAAETSNTPAFVGGFSSLHPGGSNFTFGDGSVKFIKNTINSQVFRHLANRSDGEVIDSDQF
jgi:prepilin-type processing-associated H-X9-DG protein